MNKSSSILSFVLLAPLVRSSAQAMRMRKASARKDAQVLMYRGGAVGVAGGFRSLPQALRFVPSPILRSI